jgi:hypothetical protein
MGNSTYIVRPVFLCQEKEKARFMYAVRALHVFVTDVNGDILEQYILYPHKIYSPKINERVPIIIYRMKLNELCKSCYYRYTELEENIDLDIIKKLREEKYKNGLEIFHKLKFLITKEMVEFIKKKEQANDIPIFRLKKYFETIGLSYEDVLGVCNQKQLNDVELVDEDKTPKETDTLLDKRSN